jgi:hypothetical protein
MMRLHPRAEVIISWEQDSSPEVVKVITSFLEPLWDPWTDIMVNQSTPVTELFNYAYLCPLPPVLCLLKPIGHVCIPKKAEDELSAYSISFHGTSQAV